MEYGTFRASILVFTRNWLHAKYPPEKYLEIVAALPADDRKIWENEHLSLNTMLPARLYRHIFEIAMPLLGSEPERLFREAAANTAENEVKIPTGTFLKQGVPSFIAQQMIIAWRHYFSVGGLSVLEYSSQSVGLCLEFAESYGRGSCLGVEGWGLGALTHAGAKEIHVHQPECVFRGDARCLIDFTWK